MLPRTLILAMVAVLCAWSALGLASQHEEKGGQPATLMEGLGKHHHPVAASNAQAQKFFDQGLTLLYAFNHEEAVRSFARAAALDPQLAMAYWGLALVKGSNYNLAADDEQLKAANAALQKALELAAKAPQHENDYIQALAKRYSPDVKADRQQLAVAYKTAMSELARKYPDDLDAATLYAESAMNLRPWKLWTKDGKPAPGTEEILSVLESVLRRNPDHPGANHYYIHAIEASPYAERGLPSARRLDQLIPAAGHLVHMSAHIYMRVGDYAAAAQANERAIAADQAYLKKSGAKGVYPMMYYSHNIHFLAAAHCFQGRGADALKAADQLAAHVGPHVQAMPMLEGFLLMQPIVLVRFQRWDDALGAKLPDDQRDLTRAMWHFARALAYGAKNKHADADAERQQFLKRKQAVPADAKLNEWNTAQSVLAIADLVLQGRMAMVQGKRSEGIALLRQAVPLEDALNYGEPPDWMLPVRETLGAALLIGGEPAAAEEVFRAGLKQYPRSGRCLFGLCESLKAQKKEFAARLVAQEFQAAWQNADKKELDLQGF
jgi:tetratricopeptide (TPR) repeat protein